MPNPKKGLSAFFQPAIDTVAALDPTDTLLQLLSGVKKVPPPVATPDDYNFVPQSQDLDPLVTQGMNRQNKIKQTFGKIPGR